MSRLLVAAPWMFLIACGGGGASAPADAMISDEDATSDPDAEASVTLTVVLAGGGTGTVTSDPSGIACGTTCAMTVDAGTVVTLAAAPDSGASFDGWTGGDCSDKIPCVVTVTADATVTATFEAQTHTVTVTSTGDGTGLVTSTPAGISCPGTCMVTVSHGTLVDLTATPHISSTFGGWSDACNGAGACSFSVNDDVTVGAAFAAIPGWCDASACDEGNLAFCDGDTVVPFTCLVSCSGVPGECTPASDLEGSSVEGPITLAASTDVYRFTAVAGEALHFTLTPDIAVDSVLLICAATATDCTPGSPDVLLSGDRYGTSLQPESLLYEPPISGPYLLAVHMSSSAATGSYSLEYVAPECTASTCDGDDFDACIIGVLEDQFCVSACSVATTECGAISPPFTGIGSPAPVDVWRFHGGGSATLTFEVTPEDNTQSTGPFLLMALCAPSEPDCWLTGDWLAFAQAADFGGFVTFSYGEFADEPGYVLAVIVGQSGLGELGDGYTLEITSP